jgi:hypothetical protein
LTRWPDAVADEHPDAALAETDAAEGDALDTGEIAGQTGRFAQRQQDALEGLVHHHARRSWPRTVTGCPASSQSTRCALTITALQGVSACEVTINY